MLLQDTHISKIYTHLQVNWGNTDLAQSLLTTPAFMAPQLLVYLVLVAAIATVHCNLEGDALNAWKTNLDDPFMVLQSWDPTLVNPCTWLHVTCNIDNQVTRVDLGNAGLSGSLVPELGLLSHLQYLVVFGNKINGSIPSKIGNLTSLMDLELQQNQLSGSIPASLGNLTSLRFLKLNSNNLTGTLPTEVINLVQWGNLQIMNVSDNFLTGTVNPTNSTGFAITTIIQDPKGS